MTRKEEAFRQRLEDEKRFWQEHNDITQAIVNSLQEHYEKLLEETKRCD
jgi:hypothetical protein